MSKISGPELIKLKNAVVDQFNESNWKELGALTNMLDGVERHPRLLRSLSWNDSDYDGLALTFLRKMIGENDENLSVVMDYIGKKCDIGGELISSEEPKGKKLIFSPQIFEIPEIVTNQNLVSVMMPFGADFKSVYKSIKIAATNVGLECKRVDDIWEHSTIIQDIFNLIFKSYIVVCDFTGKNPNVFYEAGIAHTLGKHVVPITQSMNDIPFDLQHHRVAVYLNNGEGRDGLTENLTSRFKTLTAKNSIW